MSIAEELHQTIDTLNEDQQAELLETARQILRDDEEWAITSRSMPGLINNPEAETDEERAIRDEKIGQILLERYKHHKQNRHLARDFDTVMTEIYQKHGW